MHATLPLLRRTDFPAIRRAALQTLQVNLGYRCNQACLHCHVNASPDRKEMLERDTVDLVLRGLGAREVAILDVTGGAPELNPHFRHLVSSARGHGVHVIDRCNLTVLSEPGFEDLADYLAKERVEITASLPCYTKENVDRQRGTDGGDPEVQKGTEHQPTPSKPIAEASADRLQRGHRDEIRRDEPRRGGEIGARVARDGRQRDDEHGRVQRDERVADRDREDELPVHAR
jgi:hypothetical protein